MTGGFVVNDLREWLPRLAGKRVLVLGDVMLDHYIAGEVDRISPEAPVPVVRVTNEWNVLGGAGNVARNIRFLGGEPVLVSLRGADADGRKMEDTLADERITSDLVEDKTRPTTIKTRIIAHNQQVVRVDWEASEPAPAASREAVLEKLARHAADAGVIILSDYGKGLIGQEFMEGFWRVLAKLPARPLVLVDPKPVNYSCYAGVDLITPNTKEAGEGVSMVIKEKKDVIKAGIALFKKLRLRHLLITLGGQGMALFENPGTIRHVPTFAKKVFDVTGAGDTVISTIGLGLAAGMDLLSASLLANYAAGIVVGQVGTAAATPAEILQAIHDLPQPEITTWLNEGS